MDPLQEALKTAFPDGRGDYRDDTRLEDVPGWDSMTSVSLVIELQSAFKISLQGVILTGTMLVGELRKLIGERQKNNRDAA